MRVQTQAVDADGNPIEGRYVSKVFNVGSGEAPLAEQVQAWIDSGTLYEGGTGGRKTPSKGIGGSVGSGTTAGGDSFVVLNVSEGRYVSP